MEILVLYWPSTGNTEKHLGFTVIGKWYTVGEFNGLEEETTFYGFFP